MKLFLASPNTSRRCNAESHDGTKPSSLFPERYRTLSFVNFEKVDGIVPGMRERKT